MPAVDLTGLVASRRICVAGLLLFTSLSVSQAVSVTLTGKDGLGTSSFNTAGKWSNLSAPVGTNDYSTAGYSLRTPPNTGSYIFAGASLVVPPTTDGDTGIIFKGTGAGIITINGLVLSGGRGLGNGQAPATQTLAGNMSIVADTGIDPGNNATFQLLANITNGNGSLYLVNVGGSNPQGTLKLSGTNTGWTGKLIATNLDASKVWALAVDSEENLGGNPSVFTPDQLLLSGALFKPGSSFALNDPNRGITLGSLGAVFTNAVGVNLAVATPITGAGNLVQAGPGTLTLLATNSYTGSTFIREGKLVLNGSATIAASTNIVVASGAVLDATFRSDGQFTVGVDQVLQGAGAVVGNLFFNSAASFQYDAVPGADTNAALLVQGNLTLDGTLQLTGLGSLPVGNYSFPLIRYTGTLTNNMLQLGDVPPTFSGSIVVDTPNRLVTLLAANVSAGSNWSLVVTPNNSRAAITWPAIAGAASYNVKRALSAAGPFTNLVNLTATNYIDSPLLNGTTYYYSVAAVSNSVEFINSATASATPYITSGTPAMMYGDSARLNRPFAKDPTVVRFQGRYLMYYSEGAGKGLGWSVGIAESSDLVNWTKVGDFVQGATGPDKNGLAAPCGRVINGQVHMFYQSYTGSASDRICHAVSTNGIDFVRDTNNPIFGPVGAGIWNNGRAIDADYIEFNGKMLLFCATRDTLNQTQQVVVASAPIGTNYAASVWQQINTNAPSFPPLPGTWENKCIEGETSCVTNGLLYMFYGGAYNNAPQQIGCASSPDGTNWTRLPWLNGQPFFADGAAGTWNSSESGHPGVFIDDDGQTYLYLQGNNDGGNTWYLSVLKLGWNTNGPFIKPGVTALPDIGTLVGQPVSATVSLIYPVPALSNLTFTVTSSNQGLVPDTALVLTGASTNSGRILTITPAPGQSGMAIITVTATDTNGISDSATFRLNVIPPGPPKFLRSELDPSGKILFQLQAMPGTRCVLQSSTNLFDWQAVSTNDLAAGKITFTNTVSTSWQSMFWRALEQNL